MPKFFIPNTEPVDAEKRYAELADFAGRRVAPAGERVSRIVFGHDGEEWTAEVGQRLTGTRTKKKRGGRKAVVRLSDSATVLAIFHVAPSRTMPQLMPTLVVTDARPITALRSEWENPFLVGDEISVTYFDE